MPGGRPSFACPRAPSDGGPYGWATIYPRPRDAMRPTLAFQIDPLGDASAVPHEGEPPAEVKR